MKPLAENSRMGDAGTITVSTTPPTTSNPKRKQDALLWEKPEWQHTTMVETKATTTAAALTSASTWEEWICESFGLSTKKGLRQARRLSTIQEARDEENENDANARRRAANGKFVQSSSSLLECDDEDDDDDDDDENTQDERKIQETMGPAHSRNSSFVDDELIIVEKRDASPSTLFTSSPSTLFMSSPFAPNEISHTKQMRVPQVSQTRSIGDTLDRVVGKQQSQQSSPRSVGCLDTKTALQDMDEMFSEAATAAIAAVAMDGFCSATQPTTIPRNGSSGSSTTLELPASLEATPEPALTQALALPSPCGTPSSPLTKPATSPRRREHKHRRSYGQLPDWTGQLGDPFSLENEGGDNLFVPAIRTSKSLPCPVPDNHPQDEIKTQTLTEEQKHQH